MPDLKYNRSRVWLAGLVLAVIVVGLASRKYPTMLPAALGSYPGDALWAVVVYLGIAFIKPDIGVGRLAGVALGVSYLVEVASLPSTVDQQSPRDHLGPSGVGCGLRLARSGRTDSRCRLGAAGRCHVRPFAVLAFRGVVS